MEASSNQTTTKSTSPSPPPTTASKQLESSLPNQTLCSSSSSSSSSTTTPPATKTAKSPSTDNILAQKEQEISKLVEEIQRLREKIKTMQHDKPIEEGLGEDLEEPETPVSPSSCNNLSPMQVKTTLSSNSSSSATTTTNATLTSTSLMAGSHTDLLSTSGSLNFHHGPLESIILGGGGGVADRSTTSTGNPLSSLNTNAMLGSGTNLVSLESQHRSLEIPLQKLQEALRQNVDKFMNESLNTLNISRCVRELLSIHNIGQRLFARYVLGLSQGTVSELLSKPKPWDKLTEKGRDSYRKMHAWAADENCINLLKSLVPRKGKEATSFKQDDPVAEEKIRQILIEAQGAMLTPSIRTSSGGHLIHRTPTTGGLTGLSNGEIIGPLGLIKSDKSINIIGIGVGGGGVGGGLDESSSDSEDRSSTGRSPTPIITSSSSHLYHSTSNVDNNATDLATGSSAKSNHHNSNNSNSNSFTNNHPLVNSNSFQGLNLRSSGNNNSSSSSSNANNKNCIETVDEQLSHDMVARIYQEELAKLIGQQVEEGFRHPHGLTFDRNPEQIRQAFNIYHQELSRIHQLVSSGAAAAAAGVGHPATDPEVFARLAAAASLVNGTGYLGLPHHLLSGLNLPSSRSPSRSGGPDGKGSPEPGRESSTSPSPRDLHLHSHHQRTSSSPSSSPPPSSSLANNLSTSNSNKLSSANNNRSTPTTPDDDSPHRQQISAFSLVRSKADGKPPYSPTSAAAVAVAAAAAAAAAAAGLPGLDMTSNGSSSSSNSSTTPIPGTHATSGNGSANNNNSVSNVANNGPSSVGAEDLSASASPLQRMQSITNSLLSQSSVPPVSSTPSRPSKAVLPPITQNQFDHYNNLNTEDIVKKVKEQLSQYSISQRLFGESVLGLSQGSVSDLLARPKPWHMLTQKGREPFIRMKMFLEDDNAVHKLVASQYKIAPEKLMRTGGYAGTAVGTSNISSQGNTTTVASLVIGNPMSGTTGGLNRSSVTSITGLPSTGPVAAPTTPSSHPHHHNQQHGATLSPNHGNTASIIATGSIKGSPSGSISSVSAKLLSDSVVRTDLARCSPVYDNGSGQISSASTPEHTPNTTILSANHSPPRGSSSYLKRRFDGSTPTGGGVGTGTTGNNSNERSAVAAAAAGLSYMQPSVYEMAALTQDLDTQAITTKIKETLMAHNIGQKIFGEIVLGLSQGSVSELLSKPKPWHMLSIKGREPFIRMQIWLTDTRNIERLQAIKNERREMNKKRRINGDEVSSISSTKSTSSSNHISLHVDPSNPNLHHHLTNTASGLNSNHHLHGSSLFNSNNNNNNNSSSPSSFRSSSGNQLYQGNINNNNSGLLGSSSINCSSPYGSSSTSAVKKPRILFTSKQKEALKLAFSMDAYPSTATMEFLAAELDLSVRTITNWFHNHRMRLKQVPNQSNSSIGDEGNNGSSSSTSLPYNMGRDGMTFDPITFRVALSQRMADLDLTGDESGGEGNDRSASGNHRSKSGSYSALNLGSNSNDLHHDSSSHLYYNPNSCSSPASSSYQEDEIGTLDLSMSSKSHNQLGSSARSTSSQHHKSSSQLHHQLYSISGNRSVTEDSDDSETGSLEDSSSSLRNHHHHRNNNHHHHHRLSSRHHHGKNTTTTITMNPITSSSAASGELDLSSRSGSTISVTIASAGVSMRPGANAHQLNSSSVSGKAFNTGSSRRKPTVVTSSSSRRKPAMPQWVAPNIDCFGDDEEDEVDDHHRRLSTHHSSRHNSRRSIRRTGNQDDETPFSTGSETEDEDDVRKVGDDEDDDDEDDDDDEVNEAERIMITRVNVNTNEEQPLRRRSSVHSNTSNNAGNTISVNLVTHPVIGGGLHDDDDDATDFEPSKEEPTMVQSQLLNRADDDDDEDKTDQEFVDEDDCIDSDLTNNNTNDKSDNHSSAIDQQSKLINSNSNNDNLANGDINEENEDDDEPLRMTNNANDQQSNQSSKQKHLSDDDEDDVDNQLNSDSSSNL